MDAMDPRMKRLSDATRQEALRRDRFVKIVLLGVSLVTVGVLIVAAVKENFLPSWRVHQLQYKRILAAKASDDWGRQLAQDFRVELRQIVVPELGVTDRCVSCHTGYDDPRMKDVPQPYRAHPGMALQWHEDSRFGCTICHRGQGVATNFADAKADDRHWDYPLLPVQLTQSSCGICHTPEEVAHRGGEVFALGASLFTSKGCRNCHQLAGHGGSLGPALDNEGLKVKGQLPFANVEGPHTLAQWLIEHFDDPQRVVPGSRMPTPGLSPVERTALTTYVLSLEQRDLPRSYVSPRKHLAIYRETNPVVRTGDEIYAELCSYCHDTGTYGRYDKFFGRFIPAIRGRSFRATAGAAYVAANIRDGRQGTIMAAFGPDAGGLGEEEIRLLTGYLLGRDVTAAEAAPAPQSLAHPRAARGEAVRGGRLFLRECSGCHGTSAEGKLGPSLAAPVFQREASDDFVFATIAHGRVDTAMPAFSSLEHGGLSEDQINDLIAWLRSLGAPAAVQTASLDAPAERARAGRGSP